MISKKDVLELESRKRIYDFIGKNPGLSMRNISRKMEFPFTTLLYHIGHLKKFGLINETHDGKYTRIYASKHLGARDKQILSLLRNENSCKILLYLFWMLSCSQIELSRELNIPPPTVSYHLKKMLDLNIIEESPVVNGRIYPLPKGDLYIERKPLRSEKFYRRKNQEVADSIYKLLIAYKFSFDNENIIGVLIDIWTAYDARYHVKVKKVKKLDDQIDDAVDLLNIFFRPPFCS